MKTIVKIFPYLLILTILIGFIRCTQKSPKELKQVGRIERNLNPQENILLTDIEGNIYKTVKIGRQVWMAENLKVNSFNDGESIPRVTQGKEWNKLTTPASCWYDNDSAHYHEKYGVLYNFHAIKTGKLCPSGWHTPTEKEFRSLISTIDPDANFERHEASYSAGGKLKEQGVNHWVDPNTGASNETNFTVLPGGCRSFSGNYSMRGSIGYFGSSTNETTIAFRSSTSSAFWRSKIPKHVGVSVRCIKDK